jgi:anti-sigma regulatory factor (Ser/Thr protein kinase)
MHANGMCAMKKEGLLVRGVEQSVGEVRRWLRHFLKDDPRVFDCALCVAELMTNALRYTDSGKGGRILVMAWVAPERIRVEVTDDGGALSVPELKDPDTLQVRGRGLQIVDATAEEWGVQRSSTGHTVWFTLGPDEALSPQA